MSLPILLLNCFRIDSSMTPPPHLNIFHCYPYQPPLPLPPYNFCCTSDTPKKIMRPPALRPNSIRHNPFTTPVTICFIASVWIREKYENFILSSYWKRGKYKILYFLDTTPSDKTNSPQQLSPVAISFIASVWIREKYENFILSSYSKRGKYKMF